MKAIGESWYVEAKKVLSECSSVKAAAGKMGMSANLLTKRFANHGLSAPDYLDQTRREKRPNLISSDMLRFAEVLGRHDSVVAAARELGMNPNNLSNHFRGKGAAASDFLLAAPLPTTGPVALGKLGQRLRGVSTKRDGTKHILEEWTKTERATDAAGQELGQPPPSFLLKKVSTATDGQGQVRLTWRQYFQEDKAKWDAFWKAARENAREYTGLAKPTKAPKLASCSDRLFDVYPIGDLHVGMYSWASETDHNFDLKIVGEDLMTMIDVLADRAPPSKRAMVVNVGDWFHAQDRKRETPTAGHRLDVDGRHAKVLRAGLDIRRRSIDRLLEKHDEVVCVDLCGNHDVDLALVIPIWLEEVYKNEPRVKILQNVNPYVYERFGTNLIGMCHGDGPDLGQLPMIMAHDRREAWGQTEHHQWITGHRHRDAETDFPSCLVTVVRTTSPRDAWAHWKGYRSSQGMTCFVFDRDGGEVDRVKSTLSYAKALRSGKAA